MTYTTAIFYFFAAILVFAGLRVITARNPVHAALYLVLAFFTAAGLWMLLEAEFLAIAEQAGLALSPIGRLQPLDGARFIEVIQ